MSSNVFISKKTFHAALAARPVPIKTARRPLNLPWRDLPALLPVAAALLMIAGFGLVAEPLVVKDLPLLLTQSGAPPAPAAR